MNKSAMKHLDRVIFAAALVALPWLLWDHDILFSLLVPFTLSALWHSTGEKLGS